SKKAGLPSLDLFRRTVRSGSRTSGSLLISSGKILQRIFPGQNKRKRYLNLLKTFCCSSKNLQRWNSARHFIFVPVTLLNSTSHRSHRSIKTLRCLQKTFSRTPSRRLRTSSSPIHLSKANDCIQSSTTWRKKI